jgi:hypothetical protein
VNPGGDLCGNYGGRGSYWKIINVICDLVVFGDIGMLQFHAINLIYLLMLLLPGVVAGAIVTWHSRSPWALFKTIAASFLALFCITIATIIAGKLLAPLWTDHRFRLVLDFSGKPDDFGESWSSDVSYYLLTGYRYSIIAPIGTVTGAALSGMLLMVKHQTTRQGGTFDRSMVLFAGFGSTILGAFLSLFSLCSLTWIAVQGLSLALSIFGHGLFQTEWGIYSIYITWGILVSLNGLICGLLSAVFGMKVARIFV